MKWIFFLIYILFFLVLGNSESAAQDRSIIDSLKQLVQSTTSDAVKSNAYANLSWNYAITRTKLDTARLYADSIQLLADRHGDFKGIAEAHYYYGLIDRFEGNFHHGIDHMEKGMRYYQQSGDSTKLAQMLYQIASMHLKLGNFLESLGTYQRSLNIFRQNNDSQNIANSLLAMGHIKRNIDKNDAIKTYEEAINLFEKLNDIEGVSMSVEGIGNAYSEIKDYERAEVYILRGLSLAKEERSPYRIADVTENLATNYYSAGNYIEALKFHLEALHIRQELPSKRDLAHSLNHVGRMYLKLGRYNQAQTYLKESLEISKEINHGLLLRRNYSALVDYYAAIDRKDQAFKYQKLYMNIKDSMVGIEKNKQLIELETKYETAQKDQEIALLTKENEVQMAHAKEQKTFQNALILGLLLLAIIAGLIFYSLRARLKNQKLLAAKNEEIRMSQIKEQLGTLEMKALRAQMNPHFLFNCMNSINRMIMAEENDKASKYLSKFSKLVRLMLENSENPKVTLKDELQMLKSYIELESIRFKNKMEYNIVVAESIDQESTFIPSMVLQPFVENAIWHGLLHKDSKGLLTILINEVDDNLHCTITDNGIGREKSLKLQKQSGHKKISMGIKITTDRLKLLTKQKVNEAIKILDIKDEENRAIGTQVDILIPVS